MKYVIIIPDGASDYPIDKLNNRTPLEVANTPNMDKLACKGFGGLTNNVPEGYTPGSDVANMSIFGYNPADYYTGRGPLEAGSMHLKTSDRDVIFRCNTIYEEDGLINNFNADHITSEESDVLLKGLNEYFNEKYDDFKGKFYTGISYRHIFIYTCDTVEQAQKLASLTTAPSHDIVGESIEDYTAWDGDLALFIKQIMNESKEYLVNNEVNKKRETNGLKPANMVWLWGQGTIPSLPNFKETYGLDGAVITGVDLLKGIGVFAGLEVIEVPGATGFFDTDYKAKGEYAITALKEKDILFVHVEAPDEAGHAKNIEEKIKALERIDEFIVGPIVDSIEDEFKIAILPDHPTPIEVGTHTRDNIPIIIYSSKPKCEVDCVKRLTEKEVLNGSIEQKEGYKLVSRLINDDF